MARIINVPTGGFIALTREEFESSDNCDDTILSVSEVDRTLIRKGLEMLRWPTRYGHYISPSRFMMDDNKDVILAIECLEEKMACNALSNSLEYLGDKIESGLLALAKSQCCDNTNNIINVNGGTNGSVGGNTPTYGTIPYSDEVVTLPDGYTSEEQYLAQKCAIANAMSDGIIGVLAGLDAIATFNAIASTTVLVLGAWSIIALPEVMIPTLIAAVAACWIVSGTLLGLSVELSNRREDLVCILYSADNPSQAIGMLSSFFDDLLGNMDLSAPLVWSAKQILMILFNADSIAKLYEEYAGYMYPSANCSECSEELVVITQLSSGYAQLIEGDLSQSGDFQSISANAYGTCCFQQVALESATGGAISFDMQILDSGGAEVYQITYVDENNQYLATDYLTSLPSGLVAKALSIAAYPKDLATSFTVRVSYTEA